MKLLLMSTNVRTSVEIIGRQMIFLIELHLFVYLVHLHQPWADGGINLGWGDEGSTLHPERTNHKNLRTTIILV